MPFISGDYLDWVDERRGAVAAAAAKRTAGNFAPFCVRRPSMASRPIIPGVGWTVYQDGIDLSNTAPHWWSMPIFWRFYTASRVAARLQQAFDDGQRAALSPHKCEGE